MVISFFLGSWDTRTIQKEKLTIHIYYKPHQSPNEKMLHTKQKNNGGPFVIMKIYSNCDLKVVTIIGIKLKLSRLQHTEQKLKNHIFFGRSRYDYLKNLIKDISLNYLQGINQK